MGCSPVDSRLGTDSTHILISKHKPNTKRSFITQVKKIQLLNLNLAETVENSFASVNVKREKGEVVREQAMMC